LCTYETAAGFELRRKFPSLDGVIADLDPTIEVAMRVLDIWPADVFGRAWLSSKAGGEDRFYDAWPHFV
jgi:hypothetical protein